MGESAYTSRPESVFGKPTQNICKVLLGVWILGVRCLKTFSLLSESTHVAMPTSPRPSAGRYGQAGQLFTKQTQAIFYNW